MGSQDFINIARRGPGRPRKWLEDTVPLTLVIPSSALARFDELVEKGGYTSRAELFVEMVMEADKEFKREIVAKIEEVQKTISKLMRENQRQNEMLQQLMAKLKPNYLVKIEVPPEIEEIVAKFEDKWKQVVKRFKGVNRQIVNTWVELIGFEVEKEVMKKGYAIKDWKQVKLYIKKKLFEWSSG